MRVFSEESICVMGGEKFEQVLLMCAGVSELTVKTSRRLKSADNRIRGVVCVCLVGPKVNC